MKIGWSRSCGVEIRCLPLTCPLAYTVTSLNMYHSVNSSSHGVNSDIAIQWEWSNFYPSQNPNP